MINDNSMATILLCSPIGINEKDLKPFTNIKWSELVHKIVNSDFVEPAGLLKASYEDILQKLQVTEDEAIRLHKLLNRGINVSFLLEEFARKGISVCTRSDDVYPGRLKKVLKKHSPAIIYYSGDISLADTAGIAIVGSRNVDETGEKFAKKLALLAVEQRFSVFSGGAAGVDYIAENAALNNGGYAISVVPNSLEQKIMNKEKRNSIISGNLLIMSSQPPQSTFSAWQAIDRNKYVYVLSRAAFVVASGLEKSGTFSGAAENMKKGWVQTFVYDTDAYEGNKVLISKGALPLKELEGVSLKQLLEQKRVQTVQLDMFANKDMKREAR